MGRLADCWFCIRPVLVLAALAPGEPDARRCRRLRCSRSPPSSPATSAGRSCATCCSTGLPLRELRPVLARHASRVDAIFAPARLRGRRSSPWTSRSPCWRSRPLVWLLHIFSQRSRGALRERRSSSIAPTAARSCCSPTSSSPRTATRRSTRARSSSWSTPWPTSSGSRPESRQELEFAAMLHDVGKIAIPKEILNKPGHARPTAEFEVMKTHTIEGQFLLDRVGGLLGRVGEIVRSCHERWDGKGYPDGLAGEEIPFASRIVFCCDAYNAMTTDRVYRKRHDQRGGAGRARATTPGTQFDPHDRRGADRVVAARPPMLLRRRRVRAVSPTCRSPHRAPSRAALGLAAYEPPLPSGRCSACRVDADSRPRRAAEAAPADSRVDAPGRTHCHEQDSAARGDQHGRGTDDRDRRSGDQERDRERPRGEGVLRCRTPAPVSASGTVGLDDAAARRPASARCRSRPTAKVATAAAVTSGAKPVSKKPAPMRSRPNR